MAKPKLSLVAPSPALQLDVPQSLRWRDGSELHVMPDGAIRLVEPKAVYSGSRCATVLLLVKSTRSQDAK